jgi:hypothetical protein
LSRVDLPALGCPIIIAKPQEKEEDAMELFYERFNLFKEYYTKL